MSLRPTQAHWFETYIPREQTVVAMETLARTGAVQLETDSRGSGPINREKLRFFVEHFRQLAASYRDDLPGAGAQPSELVGDPVHIANRALHRLRLWTAQIDYIREHLAELTAERDHLRLLAEGLEALVRKGLDPEGLFRKTRFLCKCLFACSRGHCEGDGDLGIAVEVVVHGPQHDFVLCVGGPDDRTIMQRMVADLGWEEVDLPAWLAREPELRSGQVQKRLAAITCEIADLERQLEALRNDPQMAEAHANMLTLRWFLQHTAASLAKHRMCRLTGWTTTWEPLRMQRALREVGIHAVVRFPNPPSDFHAPVALADDWWSRPFQPMVAMLGTPGREEVDPTGLLAVIVPLLFGYMFPDLGHGLVLALGTLWLKRRWPQIRFLLPCGVSSMVFGVLFGEFFALEGRLPPLWLKPLDDPLMVLAVPLLFGAGLMLLGLVFAGIGARWRGELRQWLMVDAAVLVLYAALLLALVWPGALVVAGLAVIQYFLGTLLLARKSRLAALLEGMGALLLSVFELAVNTLSFLRVGAFALAHAALSHAVMTLADAVHHPVAWFLVLVIGNAFILVMEGLLVFVQTTRLVLFEFFIRFLKAEGRLFRPVCHPPGETL
jgi:V/A-type H+-transporting ATPase subunit I